VRTWAGGGGQRLFLSRDDAYSSMRLGDGGWRWIDTVALNLLQAETSAGKSRAARLATRSFSDMTPRALAYDGDRIYAVLSNTSYYLGYPVLGAGADSSSGTGGTPSDADISDRLAIIDTSKTTLASSFEQATELTNLDLMGVEQHKLFVNLQGDGILVVDVTLASAPKALSFYRTLGWASGIEFAGTSAYVPADYYGTYRLDLTSAGNL
jgi:hypothetical protein